MLMVCRDLSGISFDRAETTHLLKVRCQLQALKKNSLTHTLFVILIAQFWGEILHNLYHHKISHSYTESGFISSAFHLFFITYICTVASFWVPGFIISTFLKCLSLLTCFLNYCTKVHPYLLYLCRFRRSSAGDSSQDRPGCGPCQQR